METWKKNLLVCWFGVFATSSGTSQITPILPLYVEHLGIHNIARIEQWSGIAFGVTTLIMAVFSPIWGHVADKYGRKPMLLRASLGMAIVISSMGFVQSVYQLVALRLLQGTISGFYSGSITLIATQTPRERAGWALGTLSTASVGGMLFGPLFGGYLAETVSVRSVFFSTGILLAIAFLLSLFFVHEQTAAVRKTVLSFKKIWRLIPNPGLIVTMFVTTFILQLALYSIEPIITVYIGQISQNTTHIALISGVAFAASGVASIIAAPQLGKLSDRIGPEKVMLAALIAAGVLFIPQALVSNPWQLVGLRFFLGIATAGLLPSVNTMLRCNIPDEIAGRTFSYNQSAQFLGTFGGSVLGGQVAALFGIHYVFFVTSVLLLINALWVYRGIYRKAVR